MPGGARAALPQLLTPVEEGEEGTITPHGKAVAVLGRLDAPRARARAAFQDAERDPQLPAPAAPPPPAPAVGIGADGLITNSKRDFTPAITKIAIPSPAALPDGPD